LKRPGLEQFSPSGVIGISGFDPDGRIQAFSFPGAVGLDDVERNMLVILGMPSFFAIFV
jgi:hypothetical protein